MLNKTRVTVHHPRKPSSSLSAALFITFVPYKLSLLFFQKYTGHSWFCLFPSTLLQDAFSHHSMLLTTNITAGRGMKGGSVDSLVADPDFQENCFSSP